MGISQKDSIKKKKKINKKLAFHEGSEYFMQSGAQIIKKTKECEVKWALGSITTNKASGGEGFPVELFQIL